MPRQQKPPEEKQKAHASKAVVARRVEEVVRIRLDGAEFWDVCEFAREKEGEEGSAWFLSPNDKPMSDSNLRRYVAKADAIIEASTAHNRKKLIRQHTAKRRNLYAKAELWGLYPNAKHVVTLDKKTLTHAQPSGGSMLAALGELLAPFPEAKQVVGSYLEVKIAEMKQLEAK